MQKLRPANPSGMCDPHLTIHVTAMWLKRLRILRIFSWRAIAAPHVQKSMLTQPSAPGQPGRATRALVILARAMQWRTCGRLVDLFILLLLSEKE